MLKKQGRPRIWGVLSLVVFPTWELGRARRAAVSWRLNAFRKSVSRVGSQFQPAPCLLENSLVSSSPPRKGGSWTRGSISFQPSHSNTPLRAGGNNYALVLLPHARTIENPPTTTFPFCLLQCKTCKRTPQHRAVQDLREMTFSTGECPCCLGR